MSSNASQEVLAIEEKYKADTERLIETLAQAVRDEVERCAEFGMYPGAKDLRIAIDEALGRYYA